MNNQHKYNQLNEIIKQCKEKPCKVWIIHIMYNERNDVSFMKVFVYDKVLKEVIGMEIKNHEGRKVINGLIDLTIKISEHVLSIDDKLHVYKRPNILADMCIVDFYDRLDSLKFRVVSIFM